MDRPDADPGELLRSLAFIRRVNRWLGYTRATLGHLQQFSKGWKPGERIEIIDLATGSADIPRAILEWATRAGFDVRVTAVDAHAETIQAAAEFCGKSHGWQAGRERRGQGDDLRLRLVRADVMDLPFEAGSFDYAITNMFLHHLDEAQVVRVMKIMDRLARRGVIVADLLRSRRAWWWIKAFTMFSNPMVRHDAVVSVAQAFDRGEILMLRDEAGLGYARYYRHFGHRFVLAGEKIGR